MHRSARRVRYRTADVPARSATAWCRAARWIGWRWRRRNTLVGNRPFAAGVEVGPFGATFTARDGAVRVALAGAPRNADIAGRPVATNTSATLADGETLTLGFARGGSFSYLAIEGGIAGEPMFGSLAVNARAGLGSPYPRPLQAGDELQTAAASGAAERRIELPAAARRADPGRVGTTG